MDQTLEMRLKNFENDLVLKDGILSFLLKFN